MRSGCWPRRPSWATPRAWSTAARPATRRPSSRTSGGSWTRTYPDGTVIEFNSSGQETSKADRNGNTFYLRIRHQRRGRRSAGYNYGPGGTITTLAYSSGQISTITDPASRVTTFMLDGHDNLTEIIDPDGGITTYAYSTPTNHEVTGETDPDDHTATPHYNSFGQLTSETLYDGTSTTSIDPMQSRGLLAPGGSGSLPTTLTATATDPDGHTDTLTFDGNSQPTGEVDYTGGLRTITYSSQGFPLTKTDPLGRTVDYTYNSDGDITSITAYRYAPHSEPETFTKTITFGVDEVPTSITDFNGNTTTYVLDSHGNVLEEEQPGGVDHDWTYNSGGQVLTYTDGDGATTSYTYNSLGRLTEIQEPGSGSPTIHYGYDTAGDVTSVTDEEGDTVTYTYDEMGRVLTEQNPVQALAGKDTAFTYDDDGNLLTVTDANGNTTSYTYNARDEKVSMTDAMDRTTSYGYDADGNLTTVTDPLDNTTTYSYTADNELSTVTDALHGTTTYAYDLDDELTSVTDPNGYETTYSYDHMGLASGRIRGRGERVRAYRGASGEYTYDNDGDLLDCRTTATITPRTTTTTR